jgi:hypothetical protein
LSKFSTRGDLRCFYDQNVEINQNAAKSNVKNTEFALQQFKIDKTTQVMQAFFNVNSFKFVDSNFHSWRKNSIFVDT